jgi:hypothetical protein
MAKAYRAYLPEQDFLLPPSLRDWLPTATALSASANPEFDFMMQQGGTAGTLSNFMSVDVGTEIGVSNISPLNDPGLTNWQAGNWVVRLDNSNADFSITWDGTCIFVVNSSGTKNKATVGSLTGQAIALTSIGVKTMTISGSAQTVLGTDRIYIELVFHNSAGVSHNFNFFADQNNDTPLVVPPDFQVSSRSDTLSDSRPSATSNHTIAFTVNESILGSSVSGSSTLTVALPAGFTISAGMDCGDVDAATKARLARAPYRRRTS